MKPSHVLKLTDPQATLETVGGKGLSLAKMIQAGFPVPDGFHVTTEAYRQFIAVNQLQAKILATLKDVEVSIPASLEAASTTIGGFFADAVIPSDITTSITEAYTALGNRQSITLAPGAHLPRAQVPGSAGIENRKSVAVRSSATAEDLPEASFAGQ